LINEEAVLDCFFSPSGLIRREHALVNFHVNVEARRKTISFSGVGDGNGRDFCGLKRLFVRREAPLQPVHDTSDLFNPDVLNIKVHDITLLSLSVFIRF
jgi:hypothetical protein